MRGDVGPGRQGWGPSPDALARELMERSHPCPTRTGCDCQSDEECVAAQRDGLGRRKLYLCGPMTGRPLFNFPAFRAAAAALRAHGYLVVSPAEMDEATGWNPATDKALPRRVYMKRDLPAMLDCSGVAVLDGWEESEGARLEVHVARECGLRIYHAEPSSRGLLRPVDVPRPKPETILEEAQRLVYGDRSRQYAHPKVHFARTVGMLNALGFRRHGRGLIEHDWSDAMMADKLARRANDPKHRDSLVDIAGYAATAERLSESENGLQPPDEAA